MSNPKTINLHTTPLVSRRSHARYKTRSGYVVALVEEIDNKTHDVDVYLGVFNAQGKRVGKTEDIMFVDALVASLGGEV